MDGIIKVLYDMSASMILPTTAAFAIAAIGLNVHFGFTGLLNMGQAGFMLIGAYGFAISIGAGLPFWAAFLIAILAGIAFALLLGIPTLKLRGDYLAIVTIAAAEIVRMIGRASVLNDVTGGSRANHTALVYLRQHRSEWLVVSCRDLAHGSCLRTFGVVAHALPLGSRYQEHP
jgi:branched-chain amino acid transport system permease protein